MAVEFKLDASKINDVMATASRFADGREAEKIINTYLSSDGALEIQDEIHKLLPVSGRTWNGKPAGAKATQPFNHKMVGNLAVAVNAKKTYQYLYFPNDGSNTLKHCGNQQFMLFGGENATETITKELKEQLIKALEG